MSYIVEARMNFKFYWTWAQTRNEPLYIPTNSENELIIGQKNEQASTISSLQKLCYYVLMNRLHIGLLQSYYESMMILLSVRKRHGLTSY